MGVPDAYLTTAKNFPEIMEAVQKAGVPPRFSYDFLGKQLGYPSSSDRPTIPVLKALRFIDDAGVPTERYRRYKDPAQARAVLAEAMREAYADLFTADQRAHTLGHSQLKGLFSRLSEKGAAVAAKMATTFRALADLADFETPTRDATPEVAPETGDVAVRTTGGAADIPDAAAQSGIAIHHDVHIHLPASTDIAVYDAIFRSLREHLGA